MDNSLWAEFYRSDKNNVKKVFVKVMTTDGKHFFFDDYNKWFEVKEHCEKNSVFIRDLHLQFRTHKCIIDVADSEGVYLIRAVMGTLGQETKHYYTVGTVNGKQVNKQMWIVPELVKEKEYLDTLDNCFPEAIIYEKTQKNRKEQVQA